jgi:SAM-dependent methyltransferase
MGKIKMTKGNLYTNTAFLYDYDNRELLKYDAELCLKLLGETSGDILEIACGTGRVTMPLAKSTDRNVVALDLSDEMLTVLKSKLDCTGLSNLKIEKANMADFQLNRKFGYIILTWRAFQILHDDTDIKNCLECIKNHMDQNTILLLSVFLPLDEYGAGWIGKESISYVVDDTVSGNRIKRYTKNERSDTERQIIEYASVYEVTPLPENTETAEKLKPEIYKDMTTLRYYYPEQIKQLLSDNGFSIINDYRTETDIFLVLKLS